MSCKCASVLSLIWLSVVTCKTVYLEMSTPTTAETAFLKRYGYLSAPDGLDSDFAYSLQSISEGLRKMQAFAGLPVTGVVDEKTKQLFNTKRCGLKDIEAVEDSTQTPNRVRRYVVQQGWTKRSISYRVLNGSSTLDKARVEELLEEGLAMWAPHGKLHFHKRKAHEGRADIRISFAAGSHGDGFAFDGPGRVVAHAFPPPHGAMHFDDDEIWGDNPDEQDEDVTDFFAVAVHEIGHALGMAHSNVKTSVMYPYYQVPVKQLHSDDILGMQELYLKNRGESEEATESPSVYHSSLQPGSTLADSDDPDENYIPDLCMANYDTLQVLQGKIYVFEEEWVWVLRDRHLVEDGYPQQFRDVFVGLPPNITIIKTIYERPNGNIAIFSERSFYEFDPTFQLIREGSISEFLIPEEVTDLTTVFVSNYNNKTYLIEEERFWRFDESTMTMDEGYPKDMSAWRNVPYPVDAAIVWREGTYFFQGPRHWKFDNKLIQAHRYYPLPTAQIWFKCESSPDMERYVTNDGP